METFEESSIEKSIKYLKIPLVLAVFFYIEYRYTNINTIDFSGNNC